MRTLCDFTRNSLVLHPQQGRWEIVRCKGTQQERGAESVAVLIGFGLTQRLFERLGGPQDLIPDRHSAGGGGYTARNLIITFMRTEINSSFIETCCEDQAASSVFLHRWWRTTESAKGKAAGPYTRDSGIIYGL